MLWRAAVVLIGGGYVVYRVTLAVQIVRARRAGDLERERRLRSRAFGILHWTVGVLLIFTLLLTLVVWLNSR
jgi:hypothetical protein